MRVLYTADARAPDGFSYAERRTWRTVIFSNVLFAMRQVINAMEEYEIDLEHENNLVSQFPHLNWLFRSRIATIWWRKRKSRIPKVCRVLTFNPYWHCGPIAEYNWQCAEEMNTLYMITYTSIDGNPWLCWPWLVTSKRKHSKEYSYRITCRRIWTFCNAD